MLCFSLARRRLSTLLLLLAASLGLPTTDNTEICHDDIATVNFAACWKCGSVFANNNHLLFTAVGELNG